MCHAATEEADTFDDATGSSFFDPTILRLTEALEVRGDLTSGSRAEVEGGVIEVVGLPLRIVVYIGPESASFITVVVSLLEL